MPVNVTGVQATLKAMRKFDPDLAKQMNRQIKGVMMPIRDKSSAYAPGNGDMLSGWTRAGGSDATIKYRAFPKYDQAEVTKGIIYRPGANNSGEIMGAKLKRKFQVTHYIANTSASGAIYETAGRVHPNGRPTSRVVASRHKLERDRTYRTASGTTKDMNSLNPNAGKQFLEPLGPIYGTRGTRDPRFGNTDQRGRLIFRAWDEDGGKAYHAVNLAIDIAVKQFNAGQTIGRYPAAA